MTLTTAQYQRLADICHSIAEVALISIVIPFLIDKFDVIKVIWGLSQAAVFWTFSFFLSK